MTERNGSGAPSPTRAADQTVGPAGRRLVNWIAAARPKTLVAAAAPVWCGSALAEALAGSVSVLLGAAAFLSAAAIQIATNLFNDALDFTKGADTEKRLGPMRVTASGAIPPKAVLTGALLALAAATLFALPLIITRGWPVLAIGIPALYLSFGYTGGPIPLAYRGLGEVFVVVFFGVIATAGAYFVQTGAWSVPAVMLGLQIGALATALIAVNNLRDIVEDTASGKRTLAVRWGPHFARVEIATLCLAPHSIGIYWVTAGAPAFVLLPLGALPIGLVIAFRVVKFPPGPEFNRTLGLAALQMVVFAVLFTIAAARVGG